MAIRMTGLASNMDTESIIRQLMDANSYSKVKVENNKTKLEWKKEKWAALNTKLYKLYTDHATKLKLQSSYNIKSVASSNEAVATASASSAAAEGSYSLQVGALATSQYVTGGKINDSSITGGVQRTTKLTDIDPTLLNKELTIKNGDKAVTIQVSSSTTMDGFVQAIKSAGINASFDYAQKRLFISSKASGTDNTFSVTSGNLSAGEVTARDSIRTELGYSSLSAENKAIVDNSFDELRNGKEGTTEYTAALTSLETIAQANEDIKSTASATAYVKNVLTKQVKQEKQTEYEAAAKLSYYNLDTDTGIYSVKDDVKTSVLAAARTAADAELKALGNPYTEADVEAAYQTKIGGDEDVYVAGVLSDKIASDVDKKIATEVNTRMTSDTNKALIQQYKTSGIDQTTIRTDFPISDYTDQQLLDLGVVETDSLSAAKTDAKSNIDTLVATYNGITGGVSSDTSGFAKLGFNDIVDGVSAGTSTMSLIAAKDSEVILNGATLTSSTTSLTANGVTFNLKGITTGAEKVTLVVSNNLDTNYKMVKDFLKQYNEVLKEMNTGFNAESARGYAPLTDDEKEAMSDTEVELWEKKIKDSLLRSDDTLGGIASTMQRAMQSSVKVGGKSYSLSSLGISTSTDYSENGLLHIYGDSEDTTYSGKEDKLKKMLLEDPELASQIMSGIANNLSDAMSTKMRASSISSALTFYNDKQITKQLKGYEEDIDVWEDRLTRMEDKYYKQFAAMEKAMSSLNAQSSSLSSLFGTSS